MEVLSKLALDDGHAERKGNDDEDDRESVQRGMTGEPPRTAADSSEEEGGGCEEHDGEGTEDGCKAGVSSKFVRFDKGETDHAQ